MKIALFVLTILSINILVVTSTMIPSVRADDFNDLIEKLRHDDWFVRDEAETKLIKIIEGEMKQEPQKIDSLNKIRGLMYKDADSEVRFRARLIVKMVSTQFKHIQDIFSIFGGTLEIKYITEVDLNDPQKTREYATLKDSYDEVQYEMNLWGMVGATMPHMDARRINDAQGKFLMALLDCKGKEVLDTLDDLMKTINSVPSLLQQCKDHASDTLGEIKESLTKDNENDGKSPDGMPDWWELMYGLDPAVDDAKDNPDGDEKNNLQEYQQGTDPQAMKDSHPGVITPVGTNMLVWLGKEIHMIYSHITEEGETFVDIFFVPSTPLPTTFKSVGYFCEVSTTSQYTGSVIVTFPYREYRISGYEENLMMLQWNDEEWEDVTVSINTDDNSITGMTCDLGSLVIVEPALLGDTDGNGKVDIFDVVTVAKAFGSVFGDDDWNPETDLNSDGIVDIYDVVIIAKNFGKTADKVY